MYKKKLEIDVLFHREKHKQILANSTKNIFDDKIIHIKYKV